MYQWKKEKAGRVPADSSYSHIYTFPAGGAHLCGSSCLPCLSTRNLNPHNPIMMRRHKSIYVAVAVMAMTVQGLSAQNIAEIASSDPLIITGAVGTQNTFYHSSQSGMSSSQWNNSVYANLNFQIYGMNMPFSFTYNNSGASFSYPQFNFRF